jgi:hypothetical protein
MANPHDFTAREAERLKALHAEQLAERQQQIGLINSAPVTQEWEGVFDPQTGLRLDISEEEAKAHEYRPPDEDEEVLEVGGDFAVIRPVQNVDDMTYGVGNTLNLVRGRRYRVSKEMAQHLASKGLADVIT